MFSGNFGRVDLSQTLSYEEYLNTGTDEERKAADARVRSTEPAAFFKEGARGVNSMLTLFVIGMTSCPDCTVVYPFVEALPKINPLIRTKYILRETPGAREFMTARTDRMNVPSVFVLKPDGTVLEGVYVETPARVTALLESAQTETERRVVWDEFRGGLYDEEVQRDLLLLIEGRGTP